MGTLSPISIMKKKKKTFPAISFHLPKAFSESSFFISFLLKFYNIKL